MAGPSRAPHLPASPHGAPPAAAGARQGRGSRLVRFVAERFLLLPLGAAAALVWANVAPESYFTFARAVDFPVNQIGMALFLALITQEAIEAVMPGGALHTWRHWMLPVAAAAGGIAGSVAVYLAYVYASHQELLTLAWPAAAAVDIAAGYYVLKVIWPRRRLSFMLLLAIATNAAGVMVIALWPAFVAQRLGGALLLLAAVAIAAAMRRMRVRAFWPYFVVCGPIAWFAFYVADVHPALALVPIVPFLPHEPRRQIFEDPPEDDPIHIVEHEWNMVVQVVLLFFGLVNAGVELRGFGAGTWAVLVASLVGRPAGILAAVWLAVAAGLRLPRRASWGELVVMALATSSGFTFALFSATSLLPVGAVLQEVKLGALATAAGALVTLAVARLLRVGSFSR